MESLPKSAYRYEPIDEDSRQIRLLTLCPGSGLDEVQVSLGNVELEEHNTPVFEALSYAWGPPAKAEAIRVKPADDAHASLFVTQSLAQALRNLRYPDKPRLLWADAVCIDQENVAERSHQVNRMGDMYKFAARVVVWLGPEQDDSDVAVDLLADLGAKVHVDWQTHAITPSEAGKDEPDWADHHLPLPYNSSQRTAVLRLLDRPWFTRLWVVQEVRLASEAVLGCGSRTIQWSTLKKALWCVHAKNMSPPIASETSHRLLTIGDVFNQSLVFSLHHLVRFTENLQCADPRDRVYSLLAICEDSLGIEPDYSLTVAEVYRDVLERWVRRYEAVHVLGECAIEGRTLTADEGPTWVPLWSVPKAILPLESRAGSAACYDATFSGPVLRVAAVQCATITSLYHNAFQSLEPEAVVSEILGVAAGGPDLHTATYRTGCSLLEALCGTRLCSDFVGQEPLPLYDLTVKRATDELLGLLRQHPSAPENAALPDASTKTMTSPGSGGYLGKVRDVGRGRHFMQTAEGFIGMAPPGTQVTDIVCVILGCRLPMVLRPVSTGFQMVGNCFLYGIGNGEAILGPIPDDWQFLSRHKSFRGSFLDMFRNNVTGETQRDDPRVLKLGIHNGYNASGMPLPVTVESVRSIGVKVKYFNLV